MRINTTADLMKALEKVLAEECSKALANGDQIWFFRSIEEIRTEPELSVAEKAQCLDILAEDRGYAIWYRESDRTTSVVAAPPLKHRFNGRRRKSSSSAGIH